MRNNSATHKTFAPTLLFGIILSAGPAFSCTESLNYVPDDSSQSVESISYTANDEIACNSAAPHTDPLSEINEPINLLADVLAETTAL